MSRISLRAIAAVCMSIGAAHAVAQSPETIVVTAARSPQPLSASLADTTVIGEDEIQRSTGQSLPQLLQRQPGLEVTMNGGPGGTSGVFIRGANSAQTLVLVDGLRVGSSSTGATSLEAIPLDQIERIEIVRGPASSLYGADAMGGVIQVFTKSGSPGFSAQASAGYGTDATRNLTAGLRGGTGVFRYALHAADTKSDGFNAIVNPANFSYNPDRDGYESKNVGGSLAFDWAAGQTVELHGLHNRLEAQSDGGPDFDDRTNTTLESYSVTSRNRLGERWTSTLTAGEGRDDSVSISAFGESPFETRQRQYSWQNDVTLPVGMLSLVLERREERLDTTNDFAVTTRDTHSVGGIYQLQQGPWSLQANLRRDDSSQYDAQTTGGIAGGYKAGEWRFTAGYSTGFRPPSFNDLYFPGFSNPNLLPEKAKNAEAGLYWSHAMTGSRIEARAVYYHNRVEDLIVFGCDADFNCRPDNVQRATLEGVTLGLDAFFGATRVAASVDLQRPEDDATGNLLPRRARRHGAVQVSHAWGPVRFAAEVVASSERFDDAANTVRMGGYAVFNATADWQVSRSWTLYVRGNNLFDRDYQLAADYSTGGASVIAGVRASF